MVRQDQDLARPLTMLSIRIIDVIVTNLYSRKILWIILIRPKCNTVLINRGWKNGSINVKLLD